MDAPLADTDAGPPPPPHAARAYAAASANRSLRHQEADVFRRVNLALRRAHHGSEIARARAIADATRLWTAVVDLVRDPDNQLPPPLKGAIASVGLAVQRELRAAAPNLEFVVEVGENLAAGLAAGT